MLVAGHIFATFGPWSWVLFHRCHLWGDAYICCLLFHSTFFTPLPMAPAFQRPHFQNSGFGKQSEPPVHHHKTTVWPKSIPCMSKFCSTCGWTRGSPGSTVHKDWGEVLPSHRPALTCLCRAPMNILPIQHLCFPATHPLETTCPVLPLAAHILETMCPETAASLETTVQMTLLE